MWTVAQANAWLVKYGATFVSEQRGVRWWKLPDGRWMAWRGLPNGLVDFRGPLPATSCGCT